ncbi:MAG: hypothetical protein Q9222_006054 [Ikaeria aurantiellina]
MTDAISVEEANKIRAAIGLKPLPVPGGGSSGPSFKDSRDDSSSSEGEQASTLESRQAQGYENWKKLQDEQDAKAKREAKNEAIKKARDAARKFTKIEGKGLGEADDAADLDTKQWLLQQKKRQRKLERERLRKLEKELEEREQAAEYKAEDLAGVRVAHELGDFDAGGEQILTLKDAGIDENEEEGDELENAELKEREAIQERLSVKQKKPVYDVHSTDDNSTILKHYDETIEGKKRKHFTLDGQGSTAEEREALRQSVGARMKSQPISLDILKDVPTSDYKEEQEPRVKKSKKKSRSTRQRPVDEDDMFPAEVANDTVANGDGMQVDPEPINQIPAQKVTDTSLADDEDLQATLAIQRKEALRKRKRVKPEDLARQLREEANNEMDEDQPANDGGLLIDETSEFVANLRHSPEPQKHQTVEPAPRSPSAIKQESPNPAEEDPDIDMDHPPSSDDERLKRETSTPLNPELTGTGLDDEANIDQGIGATLALLSQRGLIKNASTGDLNSLHRDRQRFLAEKRQREAEAERKARQQRERDRASGKLDRMSARDREEHARWENKQRDQAESRQMAEIFNREYKPNVELKYVDEFGRSMNQKEAFKHLSHQFHGKGSGKQKTEKHLKKIEDGKRREAQSSLDASTATGMNSAMGATAKKNRQAGVRLA